MGELSVGVDGADLCLNDPPKSAARFDDFRFLSGPGKLAAVAGGGGGIRCVSRSMTLLLRMFGPAPAMAIGAEMTRPSPEEERDDVEEGPQLCLR